MKNFISIALLLGTLATTQSAIAETTLETNTIQRQAICGSFDEIRQKLSQLAGEQIAIRGTSGTTFQGRVATMYLFVNNSSGSYSIVLAASSVGCVLEEGMLYRGTPT